MKKNYDSLDLLKYVMSFFIVAIHSELFPMVLYPWLRIAVPLFFAVSAFLLQNKINGDPANEKQIVRKFCIRLLKLYLFWFVVLLPVTVIVRRPWFADGIANGLRLTITNTLFSSTFSASWFIVATIEAMLIISFLRSRINKSVLTAAFLIIYCICCLRSSYYTLLQGNGLYMLIVKTYEFVFTSPVTSFPVALIWMWIGILFANGDIRLSNKHLSVIAVISAVLLYVEWRWVYAITGTFNNDCYLMLAPLAVALFGIVKDSDVKVKNGIAMRRISTITFCSHISIIVVLNIVLTRIMINDSVKSIILFVMTACICHCLSFIIMKLEKNKRLAFLRYSH